MFFKNIETERLLLKNITYDDRDFVWGGVEIGRYIESRMKKEE